MNIKIDIKGTIVSNDDKWVYDWCEIESTSPKDVASKISDANGDRLDIYINSGGGDIFAGSEIYSMLQEYNGEVVIHVVGLAGSSASVIAMAGFSEISPTAMLMIHNTSSSARGDYNVMDKSSQVLQKANKSISTAYQLKTGKSEVELLKMMNNETWLTATEAVEQGFINRLAVNQNLKLTASLNANVLPQDTINKIRNSNRKTNAMIKLLNLKKL